MFQAAVGHSLANDPIVVADELWAKVSDTFISNVPCSCILFCGQKDDFISTLVARLYEHRPDLQLAGCSSFAEATSLLDGYVEQSCCALFFCSDTVEMNAAVVPDVANCSPSALDDRVSQSLASWRRQRSGQAATKLCLVFTELMGVNQNALVQALQNQLGDEVIVLGGAAAHPSKIDLENPTSQYCGQTIYHKSATLLLFSGSLAVSTGVSMAGWHPMYERHLEVEMEPLGDGRHLEVLQIDSQPALEFFESAIGVDQLPLTLRDPMAVCYPLIVYAEGGEVAGFFDVLDKDRERGSLIITDDVSGTCTVDIARPVEDAMLDDVALSVSRINSELNGKGGVWKAAAFFISCCSRAVAFKAQSDCNGEVQTIASECKRDLPITGFYGYLEIGNRPNRPTSSRRESMALVYLVMGETWEALQTEINSFDAIRMHEILTNIHNDRSTHSERDDNPIKSSAKAETLLIEAGLVLNHLKTLSEKESENLLVHWLDDNAKLVSKRITETLVTFAHPKLRRSDATVRHISEALKAIRDEQPGTVTNRIYRATLVLGMILGALEDCGDAIPKSWVESNFDPGIIAKTIYPKLKALRHHRYKPGQNYLTETLREAMLAAKRPTYEMNREYRR